VQVTHVSADASWGSQSHLGVHVGTVHIDLTAVLVDDITNLTNTFLKYAAGGRISHHQTGQGAGVFRSFSSKICNVNVSLFVAHDQCDLVSSHDSRSRVGSVS